MNRNLSRASTAALAALAAGLLVLPAGAQTSRRDGIAELIAREATRVAQATGVTETDAKDEAVPERDPREGDATYEQAKRLMQAIDSILGDTASNRGDARKLPSKDDFLVPPLWTETREDREDKIRTLMDSALGIVTDVPVVDIQKRIEQRRQAIRDLEDTILKLKEKQLTAPKESLLPGVLADTVDSLKTEIADSEKRIESNKADIETAKSEIGDALAKSGITMTPDQIDLLLDSVLSGDLVRLVAVFNSAKLIDQQLAKRMGIAGDNMGAARKYFAMHAALFAILVHAQDSIIAKIDEQYLPKLSAIARDIKAARAKTQELMRAPNRPDQRRVLEANLESQRLAEQAAKGYRRYLLQQREQIANARKRAAHDLRIADNTYETVEASFQLRTLMKDAAQTFEALEKLEAPTFEQIFQNEELRREFENLTKQLEKPTS